MLVDNLMNKFQFCRIRVVSLSGSIPILGIQTYKQLEIIDMETREKHFVGVFIR